MAAKSVTKVTVDLAKLSSKMSGPDIAKLNRLKAQFDSTGVKVSSLPEKLPAIDWAFYKAHSSDPKLVEELEKKYSSLKIDRPRIAPSRLEDLELARKQDNHRYQKYCEVAKSFIESAEVLKSKFESMIPVKDMTMEDYCRTFPHWDIASIDKPSIWPHYGRAAGLSREEAAAFDKPDPLPYATKTAWKDWETKYKKWYD